MGSSVNQRGRKPKANNRAQPDAKKLWSEYDKHVFRYINAMGTVLNEQEAQVELLKQQHKQRIAKTLASRKYSSKLISDLERAAPTKERAQELQVARTTLARTPALALSVVDKICAVDEKMAALKHVADQCK